MALDEAPFDSLGNLVEHPYGRGAYEWRKNEPIERTLTVVSRGYSTTKFNWTDERGCTYPMFGADVMALIQEAKIDYGKVHGMWHVVRKGTTYGIKYIGEVN